MLLEKPNNQLFRKLSMCNQMSNSMGGLRKKIRCALSFVNLNHSRFNYFFFQELQQNNEKMNQVYVTLEVKQAEIER